MKNELIKFDAKTYQIPDGQGGKWKFDMDSIQMDYDTREFMRLYGKRNPNVSKRNRNNIMIVHSDREKLDNFAKTAKMNPSAVYELQKCNKDSKWAVMLYY